MEKYNLKQLYTDDILVSEALKIWLKTYNIQGDPYGANTFYIRIAGVNFPLPNIDARKKVVKFHDIHHVITGYPANWLGEAEIGAWELATGCRTSLIAWTLNAGGTFIGMFLNPAAVIRAFIRGRKTKTNLYHDFEYEPLLTKSIKEVKDLIGLV